MVDKQFTLSSDVLFDFNKATLKPQAGQALDTLYSQIEEARPKDGSATVIGYTDRIGSEAYNQKLSEQRARTVADYLIGGAAGRQGQCGRAWQAVSRHRRQLHQQIQARADRLPGPGSPGRGQVQGVSEYSNNDDPQTKREAMASRLFYASSDARAYIRRNLIEQQLPALSQLVHQGAIPIGRQHPLLLEGEHLSTRPLLRQQAPATAEQGAAVVPPWKRSTEMLSTGPCGPVLTHHPARQAAGEAEGQLVQLGIEGTCPAMVLGKVRSLPSS